MNALGDNVKFSIIHGIKEKKNPGSLLDIGNYCLKHFTIWWTCKACVSNNAITNAFIKMTGKIITIARNALQ